MHKTKISIRKISSNSYSNNLDAAVNVDFVLNKLCNIITYLCLLTYLSKEPKLWNCTKYATKKEKKNLAPLLQQIDHQSFIYCPTCKSPYIFAVYFYEFHKRFWLLLPFLLPNLAPNILNSFSDVSRENIVHLNLLNIGRY